MNPGKRWAHRIVLWLAGLGLVAGLLVAGTAPAQAFDLCKDAPAPVSPRSGMAGLLTLRPATVPAPDADPFSNPTIPIGDVYGYTWSWQLYDLGCTPDALADPFAVMNTTSANSSMSFANAGMAMLALVERLAKDTGIGWFSNWVGQVSKALEPMIFGGPSVGGTMIGLLPLALVALAVLIVWRARKANYASVMRTLVTVVICIGLAAWTVLFPALASRTVDSGIRQVATVAGGSFNSSLSDGANRQALWRAWLAGQFGDPDSQLAKDYGPRVLAATHYSWAEWDRIQADPGARAGLDKAKADEYKKIAQEVKDKDPGAYQQFQGRGDRVGTAIFGLWVGFVMGIFALFAYFMIVIGRAMMQVLVVIVPVGAVVGVLPPGHGVLMRLWDLFTAAVWAVAKFTLGAGLMASVLGLLATLDPVSAVFWMTVVTVIGFMVLRPGKEFKKLMPGLDPNRNYLIEAISKAMALALKIAGMVVTGGTSGAVAGATAASVMQAKEKPQHEQPQALTGPSVQVNQLSPGPLAAPTWALHSRTQQPIGLDASLTSPARPGQKTPVVGWSGITPKPAALPAPEPVAAPSAPGPVTTHQAVPRPGTSENTDHAQPAGAAGSDQPLTGGGLAKVELRILNESTESPGHAGSTTTPVVTGEVVNDESTLYRRTGPATAGDIVDAEIVDDTSGRDRGSDQPAGELMLYRSERGTR